MQDEIDRARIISNKAREARNDTRLIDKPLHTATVLVTEIQTDLTAYEVFCLFHNQPSVVFLDSQPGYGELGHYSILGLNPYLSLRGWPGRTLLNGCPLDEDPLSVLDRLLLENRTFPVDGLPLNGGCFGMIAYDAGFELVSLQVPQRVNDNADASQPLVTFEFYDLILIFNHETGKIHAQACGRLELPEVTLERLSSQLAQVSADRIATITYRNEVPVFPESEKLHIETAPAASGLDGVMTDAVRARFSLPQESTYMAKVEAIRELIRQGEVYIANFTHLLSCRTDQSAETLYDRLRQLNPAPFAAFLRQGDLEVLSASPERLIRIAFSDSTHTKRLVETRPIKGTRPRGRNAAEDAANAAELMKSEKDKSELLMIVDLERNDLSRICRPESIRVPELFRLETFPTVFHLVATVTGILKDDAGPVDCLRHCFPGGSITGAPKVAAMQIIDRQEENARYLYTGCLGYISLDGQADFNILIRTIVKQGDHVRYGSGGGITWESSAREEYLEMLVKAKSFLHVMWEG